MNQMKPTILFFDSGMGGLSVYKEVKQQLPNCNYLYVFDNQYFPYSEQQEETINNRALLICQQLQQIYQIDLIIVACNTASTIVLPTLRNNFICQIIGTVPAIKPAALYSKNRVIGLLATKGTVYRDYVQDLIDTYAADCIIERIGTTELVKIAENKLYGIEPNINEIKNITQSWLTNSALDVIVLGCTHFPLLKSELNQIFPQVLLIDSGEAIATRAKYLLSQSHDGYIQRSIDISENKIFATKSINKPTQLLKSLTIYGFNEIEILTI